MSLRLNNTLTKKTEQFTPLSNSDVKLYTCGPTVYDYLHVGNWAAYIYWDILVRVLISEGYIVERVLNITDVGHLVSDADEGEDKLEKGAKREGKTAWEIARFYTEDFMAGLEKLDLIRPEHIAKATDFIEEQLTLVRKLKEKGYTYQISDGIYFDSSKFSRYADFARLDIDSMKAGARVDFDPEKRNISDFALWKFTPNGVNRDMEWDTPIDLLKENTSKKGFPGWHLECSAIAMTLLGETLDIHTGGIDHIPVHHTNEIAQSEAASGKQFARFWLHNNHMKVDGSKISKSLGNGYSLQNLQDKGFSPMDFKMLVLQSHYQSEANFTFETLEAAQNRLRHWRSVACLRWQISRDSEDDAELAEAIRSDSIELLEALRSNLDTPTALKIADKILARTENSYLRGNTARAITFTTINALDKLFGFDLAATTPDIDEDAKRLIQEREIARKNKDYRASDTFRDKLLSRGIELKDTADGTVWSYK